MNFSPAKTLVLFFLGLIAFGTILLSLPVSLNDVATFSLIDNFFTAASAVCVTGLTTVSISDYYSTFGQIVILFLVQCGGLGYMFVSTITIIFIGKVTIKDRHIMQVLFDINTLGDLKILLRKAVIFVLGIELVGAIVLTIVFLKEFSFWKAFYFGIFHSVSAFCNAGFSLFENSLIEFSGGASILLVVTVLVILGGLGFFVLVDIYDTYKENHIHLMIHTKVVLISSLVICVLGFLFFLIYMKQGVVDSLFQTTSLRTAGFTSTDLSHIDFLTKLILIILMSIGAAPAGTGGGLKITTVVVLLLFIRDFIRSDRQIILFNHKLSGEIIKKACAIFVLYTALIIIFSMAIVIAEPNKNNADLIFEMVSALSNTGSSLGISAGLNNAGKILDIAAMIIGRIGILTLLMSVTKFDAKNKTIDYPLANIFVG